MPAESCRNDSRSKTVPIVGPGSHIHGVGGGGEWAGRGALSRVVADRQQALHARMPHRCRAAHNSRVRLGEDFLMGRTERRGETSGTRRHGTTRRRTAHRQALTQAVLTFRSTYAYHTLSTCACMPAVALLPLCFPLCSYFVAPGNLQAALRGAVHRRAMHFLCFAVAGILEASSGL